MTTVSIGSQIFGSISEAIKAAQANSTILIGPGLFNPSPASLAGTKAEGITLKGTPGELGTILSNTRIFSRGTDGGKPSASLSIEDLQFDYQAGSQGYILSPSIGSVPYNPLSPTSTGLSLRNLSFQGQHAGAIGANGTYFDLSGSKNSKIDNITVNLKGQKGYDPTTGEGGGFFIFLEGGDNLQVLNSSFDEKGFSSSVNAIFTNNVTISNNEFKGGGLTKQDDDKDPADAPRGERFYNAGGLFSGNKLSEGSFFDFHYNPSTTANVWTDYKAKNPSQDGSYAIRTTVTNNQFDIIDHGYGVLINSDAPASLAQLILTITDNIFNSGIAIRSKIKTQHELIFGQNTVNTFFFDELRVGGEANDEINKNSQTGLKRWISGGEGNDELYGTPDSFDSFAFWAPLNTTKNVDTITGFDTNEHGSDQIWLDQSIFANLISSNGLLDAAYFVSHSSELISRDHAEITYNTSTGELSYDPDGNGLASSTIFARLQNKESLSPENFRLIGPAASPAQAQISVTGSPNIISETNIDGVTYVFRRGGPTDSPLAVQYILTGSADQSDYTGGTTGTPQTIHFAVNESTVQLTLNPIANSNEEVDETVILTLIAGTNYMVATPNPLVTTIRRDEAIPTPPPSDEAGDFKLLSISLEDNGSAGSRNASLNLAFSRSIKAGSGRFKLMSADGVVWLDPADNSLCTISDLKAVFNLANKLQPGMHYTLTIGGAPFTDLTGQSWAGFETGHYDFSTAAALVKDSSGRSRLKAGGGLLELEDENRRAINEFLGDFTERSLAQISSSIRLNSEASQLLGRYVVHGPSIRQPASDDTNSVLDLSLTSVPAGSATVATIKLATEVNATASLRIKSSGEVEDNTYDPATGQGVELLDSDGNGLVDTLRIHLRDGSGADDDGVSDGRVRTTSLLAEAPRRTVYRFYNQLSGVHFYTPDAGERDTVIRNSYGAGTTYSSLQTNPRGADPLTGGWGYKFEGTAYEALDTQGTALYRFYNAEKRYHFLSTSAEEANNVINNSLGAGYDLSNAANKDPLTNGWGYRYEGTSYKVSTIAQHGMNQAVYRFYNAGKGVHFYTASAEERDNVIRNSVGAGYMGQLDQAGKAALMEGGWGYRYEGLAWYV